MRGLSVFGVTVARFVQEFCKPYKKIGLTNFMHDITFGNDQISMLLGHNELFLFYLKNKVPVLCADETGRTLSSGIYMNRILEERHRDCAVLMPFMVNVSRRFGLNLGKNSLHIVDRENDCQHFYSLFFDLSESDFLHWVINNGSFLTDFIANYNVVAKDVTLEARSPESRIILPNLSRLNDDNNENKNKSDYLSVLHKDINMPIFLSHQQGRCLKLLAQGKSAKQIATEMKLSYRTIEHYFERIRKLLGCKNNKELLIFYLDQLV